MAKARDRAFRIEQKKRHAKPKATLDRKIKGRPGAYQRNKRSAERTTLRQGDWGWL